MNKSISIAIAAALTLCGCASLQRSSIWESVVSSHSGYTGGGEMKDGYAGYLHELLASQHVEHKVVTYQFHYHNGYHEEEVGTETVVLYRDDSSSSYPWWAADEYHYTPVWMPNWDVKGQVEFFVHRPVEIVSVKEYSGDREAKVVHPLRHAALQKKSHSLFAGGASGAAAHRIGITKSTSPESEALGARSLSGSAASAAIDARAGALFRAAHGTQFDPESSLDRQKMAELRHRLLNRNQSALRLRPQ